MNFKERLIANKKTLIIGGAIIGTAGIALIIHLTSKSSEEKKVTASLLAKLDAPVGSVENDPVIGNNPVAGDYTDLNVSQIFNRAYAAVNALPVSISIGTPDGPGQARKYAKIIYDAKGLNDSEDAVVGIFRSLKYKADVSKLADAFYVMYKTDLLNYLMSFMTNGCGADQDKCWGGTQVNNMKQIFDIIKTKL